MSKLVEKIFVIAMLLYTTGAVLPFLAGNNSATQASSIELAVEVPLYALVFLLILLHAGDFLKAAWKTKWILTLVLLAVASSAWSQVPMFTIRRSLILLATTAFGIYFGASFDIDEQLSILAWVFGFVICGSILFAIAFPGHGVDNTLHRGSWQGVFSQKNVLGRAMVLSLAVFYFVRPRLGHWVRWTGFAASLVLLALARSATGIVVFSLVAAMFLVFKLLRAKLSVVIPIFCFACLLLGVVALSGESTTSDLLHVIHRDPGLTGRTSLWDATWSAISQRPWFGYGFDSFWLGMQGASGALVQQLHWSPPNSHNGFLDLLLEVGIFGLSLFAIGYLVLFQRALRFLRSDPGPGPLWLCTYLFFLIAYNFSERTVLDQNNIFWVVYVSTAVNLYLDVPIKVRFRRPTTLSEFQSSMTAPGVS